MPSEPLNQSDSSFLFKLYITPPDDKIAGDTDIQGDNVYNNINHDHSYSLPKSWSEVDMNNAERNSDHEQSPIVKGYNSETMDLNHKNMKGQNLAAMKGYNSVNEEHNGKNMKGQDGAAQDNPTVQNKGTATQSNTGSTNKDTDTDSGDVSNDDPANISKTIQDMWKAEA